MMRMRLCSAVFVFLIGAAVFAAPTAHAATLFVSPASGSYAQGQTFSIVVRVNSTDQAFNAAQATLQFPTDVLQVVSLDSSPAASAFDIWLQQPTFSNSNGTVNFIGGTANGVLGAAVPILTVTFRAKSAGTASVVPSADAVTAADGSGTNILSLTNIGEYSIQATTGAVPSAITLAASSTLPAPVQITRTPAAAQTIPARSPLTVPLYPDPTQWYNLTANFSVSWVLPPDVSGISTAFNNDPTFAPPAVSEGLFQSKIFPAPSDGVSYLHIRFQNALGWGPAMDYRIAVDTVPPLPFTVTSLEGTTTGNPAPTLQFKAGDSLSGVDHYVIQVDDTAAVSQAASTLTLPPTPPGPHTVTVEAIDKAGNTRESSMSFTILPIGAPTITAVSGDMFIGEGNGSLSASGTALASSTILLALKDQNNAVVEESTIPVDGNGNWQAVFSAPLKEGTYVVEVTARDSSGAMSFPVRSTTIAIRYRPLFTFAGIDVTQTEFFLGILALLLAGFGAVWYVYHLWQEQLERRVVIAERDVINTFDMIRGDLEQLDKKQNKEELMFLVHKMQAELEKAEKYVIGNIQKISK